jgi:hypothetical protein
MTYTVLMRTTLDIADDVLFAAKEAARREGATVGAVLTRLARQALLSPSPSAGIDQLATPEYKARLARLGITPLPRLAGGGIVTDEMVNRIRDEEGI